MRAHQNDERPTTAAAAPVRVVNAPIAQLVRATDFNRTMERRRRNAPDERRYMLEHPESRPYSFAVREQ
jgi:hypothetical protein